MSNKNKNLCKFSDVGIPEIVISTNKTDILNVNIEKSENKTVEINVIVDQAKGSSKD